MKKLHAAILGALVGLGVSLFSSAFGQSTPGFVYGQVPTAAQWNSYFAAKQDVLGFPPVNKQGDVMQGELVTIQSSTVSAGLNIAPGLAPTTPVDGDLWTTAAGLFVQINGGTIGPLIASLPPLRSHLIRNV